MAAFHCPACSTRSRANLTQRDGRLWRPECLYTVAAMGWAHQALAPHVPTPAHGLKVVDIARPRRRPR